MKKIILYIFLFTTLLQSKAQNPNSSDNSILYGVQYKIYEAFMSSFDKKGTVDLVNIEKEIQTLSPKTFLSQYWYAYAKYYESIAHLECGNKKQSKLAVKEAISILENINQKNSESYALLALCQSFSIQFTSGMGAGILSNKIKTSAATAIDMDSNNVRAWYVLASNDYYTPKQFGGGKKTEEYLLKAISLREQQVSNPLMPSWGKSDAYSLLVSYYIDNKKINEARKKLTEALKIYPNNYMLKQHAKTLYEK